MMADQEKHIQQSKSPEEQKALQGAKNAAVQAHRAPATGPQPTPSAGPGTVQSDDPPAPDRGVSPPPAPTDGLPDNEPGTV